MKNNKELAFIGKLLLDYIFIENSDLESKKKKQAANCVKTLVRRPHNQYIETHQALHTLKHLSNACLS